MPKRNRLSTNFSSDIYKRIITPVDLESTIPKILLEFVCDCQIDIGPYISINRDNYPKIFKSFGERISAFEDQTRGGYCFDQLIEDSMITMFIPSEYVKRIII